MKMKLSYRSLRGHTSGRRHLFAATLLVIFLFSVDLLSDGAIRDTVRLGGTAISRGVARAERLFVGSSIFSSRRALVDQNQSLTEKLAWLEKRVAGGEALKAENDQLRALVHLAEDSSGVTAPIISSLYSSPYGTFLIGAGSEDGVALRSLVLTYEGFVVGVVSDTGSHTGTVTEIFAPGASIDALVSGAAISVFGSGGGNAHAEMPRNIPVAVGDPVVAPQFGQRAIGIVGRVASSSARASQDVYIRIPVNLASLQYVYIIPAH